MRKVSLIIGFSLLAVAGTARAQNESAPPALDANGAPIAAPAPEAVAAPAAAPAAAASDSKMQVGLNLLPMALGKLTAADTTADAAFAYGVGLSFGYNVIPGLSVGIAPQMVLNVKGKDGGDAAKEYDLMARVAYAYTVAPKFAVYGEVLPGYSIISPKTGDSAKGLVLAFGAGATMDVTDQLFLNLGVGYQMGFQKVSVAGTSIDLKDKFLRVAVGVGMRL